MVKSIVYILIISEIIRFLDVYIACPIHTIYKKLGLNGKILLYKGGSR